MTKDEPGLHLTFKTIRFVSTCQQYKLDFVKSTGAAYSIIAPTFWAPGCRSNSGQSYEWPGLGPGWPVASRTATPGPGTRSSLYLSHCLTVSQQPRRSDHICVNSANLHLVPTIVKGKSPSNSLELNELVLIQVVVTIKWDTKDDPNTFGDIFLQ